MNFEKITSELNQILGDQWPQMTFIASIIMFVVGLLSLPAIIFFLPADHFDENKPPRNRHWVVFVLKNLVGVFLILAGLAMLVLPGQGLLVLFIGLSLTNFPHKKQLIRKIMSRPKIQKGLNKMRRKLGKTPFYFAPNKDKFRE